MFKYNIVADKADSVYVKQHYLQMVQVNVIDMTNAINAHISYAHEDMSLKGLHVLSV